MFVWCLWCVDVNYIMLVWWWRGIFVLVLIHCQYFSLMLMCEIYTSFLYLVLLERTKRSNNVLSWYSVAGENWSSACLHCTSHVILPSCLCVCISDLNITGSTVPCLIYAMEKSINGTQYMTCEVLARMICLWNLWYIHTRMDVEYYS